MKFNHERLLAFIEKEQMLTRRGAYPSLRTIACEAGVPPSLFTRLRKKQEMSVGSLVKLVKWLDGRSQPVLYIWAQIFELNEAPKRERKSR